MSFIKNIWIYLLSNIINQAIPFILLPILTRYLNPEDYGLVAMFFVIEKIMQILAGFSCYGAVGLAYFELSKTEISSYIGTTLLIIVSTFTIMVPTIALFQKTLSHLTGLPLVWLLFTPIVGIANVIILTKMTLWQSEQKSLPYGIFMVLQSGLSVGLAIYLVVILNLSWQGRLISGIVTAGIFSVISLWILIKSGYLRWSWNKNYAKDMLRFGVPLVPHQAASWIKYSLDRLMIVSMIGLGSAGIYAVAAALSKAVSLLVISFATAWSPYVFGSLSSQKAGTREHLVRLSYLYLFVLSLCAAGYAIGAPHLIPWVIGPHYKEAFRYLPLLVIAELLDGYYRTFAVYIFYTKRNEFLSMVTTASSLVHLGLLYISVKQYGIMGAAVTMIISSFINFTLTAWLSNKVYPMPWNLLLWKPKNKNINIPR